MRTDLILKDNDLVINDNDAILGQSDDQHIMDTINAYLGWWKENPTDGVGVSQFLLSRQSQAEINRAVILQLQADSYKSQPIIYFDNTGTLIINPNVTI